MMFGTSSRSLGVIEATVLQQTLNLFASRLHLGRRSQ